MTAKEITDRLIENMETVIKAANVPDPFTIPKKLTNSIMLTGSPPKNYAQEFAASLAIHTNLPAYVKRVVQILSAVGIQIEEKGNLLLNFAQHIKANQNEVESKVNEIMNNQNLGFIIGTKFTPMSNVLVNELNDIDREARVIENYLQA